eukprot:3899485-Rhodomonas_salina.1
MSAAGRFADFTLTSVRSGPVGKDIKLQLIVPTVEADLADEPTEPSDWLKGKAIEIARVHVEDAIATSRFNKTRDKFLSVLFRDPQDDTTRLDSNDESLENKTLDDDTDTQRTQHATFSLRADSSVST